MLNKREIILDQNFTLAIEEITEYIENIFGKTYIPRFKLKLWLRLKNVTLFPETGRETKNKFKNKKLNNIFYITFKHSWIFYKFTNSEIIFLDIVNSKKNLKD